MSKTAPFRFFIACGFLLLALSISSCRTMRDSGYTEDDVYADSEILNSDRPQDDPVPQAAPSGGQAEGDEAILKGETGSKVKAKREPSPRTKQFRRNVGWFLVGVGQVALDIFIFWLLTR